MGVFGLALTFLGLIVQAQSYQELNPLYYEVSGPSGPRSPVSRDKGTSLGTPSSPWWFTHPAFTSTTTESMPPQQVKYETGTLFHTDLDTQKIMDHFIQEATCAPHLYMCDVIELARPVKGACCPGFECRKWDNDKYAPRPTASRGRKFDLQAIPLCKSQDGEEGYHICMLDYPICQYPTPQTEVTSEPPIQNETPTTTSTTTPGAVVKKRIVFMVKTFVD